MWVTLLPTALLRVRITPKARTHLGPYEILYGRPFLNMDLLVDPETHCLAQYLPTLGLTLKSIWEYRDPNSPKPDPNFTETPPHLTPGHLVYVKALPQDQRPFTALWTGPYRVLLTTPKAAKIQGFTPRIHVPRLKTAPPPEDENPQLVEGSPDAPYGCEPLDGLHLLFRRQSGDASPTPESRQPDFQSYHPCFLFMGSLSPLRSFILLLWNYLLAFLLDSGIPKVVQS